MSPDVLSLWQGNGDTSSQNAASGTANPAASQKIPESFWWYVMLAVFICVTAESVLASRYLGTQREES